MEERILVYKDEAKYDQLVSYYKAWTNNLQELVSGLCKLKIEASKENLKKLLAGEDLRSLMEDNDVSKHLSFLPERMRKHIQNSVDRECDEDYMKYVGDNAVKFKHYNENSSWGSLKWNHFVIEENTVKTSKECEEYIDKMCCVYVDTPNKKVVYNAYLKFMEAYNELERAVKESSKMPNPNNTGALCAIDHTKLRALGSYGSYSLVRYIDGGELELVGYRFEDLQ